MEACINILLLGRSGAGKSSLANYLYQQEVFKTGDGSPVTAFGDDIKSASIATRDHTINIFDAPGLEPANFFRWKKEIGDFMGERSAFDSEPSRWIHGAFYVVNAASERIEPAEIEIIREFPQEFHFPISVVFTNCDAADKVSMDTLAACLEKDVPGIRISRVCSVKRKKRGGAEVEPFGRDELLRGHAEKVAFYFEQRVGIHLFGTVLPQVFGAFILTTKNRIDDSDIGLVSLMSDSDAAMNSLLDINALELEISEHHAIRDLEGVAENLDAYIAALNVRFHSVHDVLERMMDIDFDSEMERLAPMMKEITEQLESESVFDKIGALFKVGWFLLTVKGQLCDVMDNFEAFALEKCFSSEKECRRNLADPLAFQAYAEDVL